MKAHEMTMRAPFLAAVMYNENIGSTMVVLCLAYAGVFVEASWQLRREKSLNTKTLFLLSVTTACGLRFMCFVGFCLIRGSSLWDVRTSLESEVSGDLEFYARAVIVLFDLPDFMLASTYVLLVVVWAECFLGSRRHWLSAITFKQTWHLAYFVFNMVLYSAQLVIYVAVFVSPNLNKGLVALLYLVPAVLTFAIPGIHLVLYIFLSLRFAGFPMVSRSAALRLSKVAKVTFVWTASRLAWSIVVSATVLGFFSHRLCLFCPRHRRHHSEKHHVFFEIGNVAMVGLFLFTEILPFVLTLDSGLLQLLDKSQTEFAYNVVHHHNRRRHLLHHGGTSYGTGTSSPRGPRPSPPRNDDSIEDTLYENDDSFDSGLR